MGQSNLAKIDKAIELQGRTRETILSLEKSVMYQTRSSGEDLNELRKRLQRSLDSIKDAFESNCEQQLKAITPMLGRLPTNGLILQNQEARKELDEVRSLCTHEGMDDLSRERLETMITYIASRTRAVCERIVYSTSAQETILEITKKALHQEVR